MNQDTNNPPVETDTNGPNNGIVPQSSHGTKKVVEPSEALKLEIQAQTKQQSTQQLTPAPEYASQPIATPSPMNMYPQPTPGQMQVGMSASQLGLNEPKHKLFDLNPKKLVIKGLIVLVAMGSIFTVLVMTNVIALSEFKNIGYSNSKGTNFRLDFYSKHGSKQLSSGNTQLISKVSKDGKFPITVSISTTDEISGYNRAKDCSGFTRLFDVQNNNLNQKIAICDFGKQGSLPASGVYIAGFMHDNKAHIITISQDYGSIDISSQSGAQQSLNRFGMEPYKVDIETIVSSIKVE